MTDQIQVAKEWLDYINKILSSQTTKVDYEFGKKRADALEYLINRVEELEEELNGAEQRYGFNWTGIR